MSSCWRKWTAAWPVPVAGTRRAPSPSDWGWFYVWGVEFVELGLGDSRERNWHRGEKNTEGLHGNAILSRIPLRDPVLVRLDDGATWFAEAAEGQRRVGGRMGLGACIQLAGKEIAVFAVHIESRSSPEHRAQQTGNLLHAVNTGLRRHSGRCRR